MHRLGSWSCGAALVASALAATVVPAAPAGFAVAVQSAPAAVHAGPGRFILSGPDATDPFILHLGSTYYLYTGDGNYKHVNVPVYAGPAIGAWSQPRDALPVLPRWARPRYTWAPDVRPVADGYVLYFTALRRGIEPSEECIGEATGASPLGPFTPGPTPFVCQDADRGSIDPRTLVDRQGRLWLVWKSDDNANPNVPWRTPGPHPAVIWIQRLSSDGRHLVGPAVRIFSPQAPWEGSIVEAPDMVPAEGSYWLFFSGGWFNTSIYGVGVARCTSPLGPCRQVDGGRVLGSNGQGEGPGESSVFVDGSSYWLLYNPWCSNVPKYTPPRPAAMAPLVFTTTGPELATAS